MKVIFLTVLVCHLTWSLPLEDTKYPEMYSGYFEGDMVLSHGQRNGMLDTFLRWPGAIVPYELDKSYNDNEKMVISQAMDMFHKFTCIKFRPRGGEADYIYITQASAGCFSNVGKIGGRQEVNLSPPCLRVPGTAAHEMMHAVGFVHEHNRFDRDNYVTIVWENLANTTQTKADFRLYSREVIGDFGESYDYHSVMHYGRTAFTINGKDTVVPHDPNAEIGQREGLSSKDTAKINNMYKCTNKSN